MKDIELEKIYQDPIAYANNLSIKELVKLLNYFNTNYNNKEQLIADFIYDEMLSVLEDRDPNNKFLLKIGAEDSEVVPLPFFMGSLNKIKHDEKDAVKKLKNWINKYTGPYVISHKLDGMSGELYNDNGELKLYKRGTGDKGFDISHLIKYVVSKDIDLPEGWCVRGELIMSIENFNNIQEEYGYKNTRGAVAALVNSKTIDKKLIKLAKLTDFVTYDILNPIFKYSEKFKKLDELGFDVADHITKKEIDIEFLTSHLIKERKKSEYDIDGIVISDSSQKYELKEENPKYAIAFKVNSDGVEATVVDVIWNISKNGYFKPKIQIKPVTISGVTITYATAYNAKYVVDNELGPDSRILIVRSGEVIPKIVKVIESTGAKMPDANYIWNESGVDIMIDKDEEIDEETNNEMIIKKITAFFKKLSVKWISDGFVTKLVDNGYNTIDKILLAKKKDLINIEGIGETLVDKIYDGINNSLANTDLSTFMASSQLFEKLGEKKLKLITDEIPDIMTKKYSDDDLRKIIMGIDGYSDKSTEYFIDGFHNFKKFFEKINKIIDISYLKEKKKVKKASKGKKAKDLEGAIVVFSGVRDKELEKFITENGGKVSTSVSGKTTLLIYGGSDFENNSKYNKALDMGIEVIEVNEFKKKYKI